MSNVLIFTGCPGAGKSTAGELFAGTTAGTWAYIDQDEVRKQVRAGFKNPGKEWDDQTQVQWDVSVEICADMARRYKKAGINVLVDGFMPPDAFDSWETAFWGVDYKVAVLLPTLATALSRNAGRIGDARLPDELIQRHHEWFTGYVGDQRADVIDSTNLSPQDVVRRLAEICFPPSAAK